MDQSLGVCRCWNQLSTIDVMTHVISKSSARASAKTDKNPWTVAGIRITGSSRVQQADSTKPRYNALCASLSARVHMPGWSPACVSVEQQSNRS